MLWHGYLLLEQPAALTGAEWQTVATALARILGQRDESGDPSRRLQWRLSSDGSKVLFEAVLDTRDLDVEDLSRLRRYISESLEGRYTPEQVREAMGERMTVFAGGGRWFHSQRAAQVYLQEHRAEWEAEDGSAG